jgi:uncharacterized protein YggE
MVDQPMVVVRGEAVREVAPELARFSVTVAARDKDRQAALARLAERAASVRALLDSYAQAIERRETGGVHLRPELRRTGERVAAYAGSVSTVVTVTDFTVLGDLLLRLADQDQTTVAGPWWELRPGSAAGAEVRQAAIAEALTRAGQYAAAVGARLDRLVEIADDGAGGGAQPMMRTAYGLAQAGDAPELELDPQPQVVRAGVQVRVAITEPRLPDQPAAGAGVGV